MYPCDCNDYCDWCHPEMCEPVALKRFTVKVQVTLDLNAIDEAQAARLAGALVESAIRILHPKSKVEVTA